MAAHLTLFLNFSFLCYFSSIFAAEMQRCDDYVCTFQYEQPGTYFSSKENSVTERLTNGDILKFANFKVLNTVIITFPDSYNCSWGCQRIDAPRAIELFLGARSCKCYPSSTPEPTSSTDSMALSTGEQQPTTPRTDSTLSTGQQTTTPRTDSALSTGQQLTTGTSEQPVEITTPLSVHSVGPRDGTTISTAATVIIGCMGVIIFILITIIILYMYLRRRRQCTNLPPPMIPLTPIRALTPPLTDTTPGSHTSPLPPSPSPLLPSPISISSSEPAILHFSDVEPVSPRTRSKTKAKRTLFS